MIRSWLWLLFVSHGACAAALAPIFSISDTDATYVQVPLTYEVYRYSRYSHLQDLVVVDVNQNPLPYRVVSQAPAVVATEEQALITALAFYPIMANATPEHMRELRSTHIRVEDTRVQVNIDHSPVSAVIPDTLPDFYLIDVSALETEASELQITWLPHEKNQYVEVELEASSNLQDWVNLGRSTLVQITQGEQQVTRNRLPAKITPQRYEFLRLRVKQGAEGLNISSISAVKIIPAVKSLPETESWQLGGVVADTQTTVYFPSSHAKTHPVFAWEYARDERTPAEQLSLDFSEATHADALKIFSRNSEKQNWELRYAGIWFHLKMGDQWHESDPIALGENSDKFWRVELNAETKDSLKPELVFSWQPRQLHIITNRQPPYTVAINPQDTPTQNNQLVDQLLGNTKPDWVKAELVSLNANPVAVSAATETRSWKKYVFWVLLAAALAVLLVFAFRLFKQVVQAEK